MLYPNFGWDEPAYHLEGDPEGRLFSEILVDVVAAEVIEPWGGGKWHMEIFRSVEPRAGGLERGNVRSQMDRLLGLIADLAESNLQSALETSCNSIDLKEQDYESRALTAFAATVVSALSCVGGRRVSAGAYASAQDAATPRRRN